MREITQWLSKKYIFLKEINYLHVRKTPKNEWFDDVKPYLVNMNNLEQTFMYEDGRYYLDESDHWKQMEEIEKHKAEVLSMEEEGKTEDQIREEMDWKGTQYIIRVEYIIQTESTLNVDDAIALL